LKVNFLKKNKYKFLAITLVSIMVFGMIFYFVTIKHDPERDIIEVELKSEDKFEKNNRRIVKKYKLKKFPYL